MKDRTNIYWEELYHILYFYYKISNKPGTKRKYNYSCAVDKTIVIIQIFPSFT